MSGPRQPVGVVLAGAALAGVGIGVLWAWLAPPLRRAYALTGRGERVTAYLGDEAEHYFDGAALMALLLTAVAIVGAVAAYQWRSRRGPQMAATLLAGVGVGGVAAAAVGVALARLRYGGPDIAAAPLTPQDRIVYFTQAPAVFFGSAALQVVVTFALPAVAVALTYAVCALLSPDDDLGVAPAPPTAQGSEGPAFDRTADGHLGGDQQQP